MHTSIKNFLFFLLSILTLALFPAGCKKKDVYPSQQLPEIQKLLPVSGQVGSTVVIKGTNLKNASAVKFGSRDAANFSPSASTDTSITVKVPDSLTPGSLYVQVYLKDGSGYSAVNFTVIATPPVPKVDSVSPTKAFPGVQVTISGKNFALVNSVTFGGIAADSFAHTLDTNGKLVAVVPANAVNGDQFLVVRNSNGADSIHFNVDLSPGITSITPASGEVGDLITVKGARFKNISAVQLGLTNTTYTVVDPTTITFTVPAGTAKTTNLKIVNPSGSSTSTQKFTFIGAGAEYFIFDDALNANWWTGGTPPAVGWSNVTDMANMTPVKSGTKSVSINYTGSYGGFQLGFNAPGLDLSTYSVVKISIYGGTGTGGKKVKLVLNGDYNDGKELIMTAGAWTDFVIPISDLGNPTALTELVLQEFSGNTPEFVYIDNVGVK